MLSLDHFQAFLDDISNCFINKDFAAWERHVELPFSMVTSEGTISIKDQAGLRQNFEHYLTACKVMNIDAIVRKPIAMDVCQDGNMLATYETELLSHGHRATAPYESTALLHLSGTTLKMTSILNGRGHYACTGLHPSVESASLVAGTGSKADLQIAFKAAS